MVEVKESPVVKDGVVISMMQIREKLLEQIQHKTIDEKVTAHVTIGYGYLPDEVKNIQKNLVGWITYYPKGSLYRRNIVLYMISGALYKADGYSSENFKTYFQNKYPTKQILVV